MKKIILISGHAQNGKDTTAQFMKAELEERGERVVITHYASILKWMCKEFYGWNGEKDEKGRALLQHVGTDIVRHVMPNFFAICMKHFIWFCANDLDYVIIADTRFPNELNLTDTYPIVHVRVDRPDFESPLTPEQQNHPSETALDDYRHTVDYWVINDGTLEQLEGIARHIASNL